MIAGFRTEPKTAPFNSSAFEAWLRSTGRCWNHLNTEQKRAAMKEYKAR